MDKEYRVYKPILRGILIFTWTISIKLLTSLVIYTYSVASDSPMRDLPDFAIHLVSISAALFIYNSVLRLISLFDASSLDDFLLEDHSNSTFSKELLGILKSKDNISESITAMFLFAISCLMGAFPEIAGLFLEQNGSNVIYGLLSFAIIIPLFIIIGIFCKYEVRRYWKVLYEKQELEKIGSPLGFLWRAVLITLAYPIVYPFLPLLLFVIFNAINLLVKVIGALNFIGTIIAIFSILIVVYFIPLLRGILKRRKFIKKLKIVCAFKGYTLSDIKSPYSSFTHPKIGSCFIIKRGNEEYHCAFVSTLHRGTHLYFTTDTDAYFRHRIGTKNHHFTINHHIEYGIRGNVKKFIIISPLPKHVFADSDGSVRELLPGDKMWDYIMYNMSGFLNAIDRDCLDKYNITI